MSSAAGSPDAPKAPARIFRLPRLTYLIVIFLLFCTLPLAFAGDGSDGARPVYGPRMALLLIPILAIFFIARTSTAVDGSGLTVRAVFGVKRLGWDQVRGLSISGRAVYAVSGDGAIRLPCVRTTDLAELARASAGRVPQLEDAPPKFAPSRRKR